MTLDPEVAQRLARLTLGHVTRQYPNKLDHVMGSAADVAGPATLHPVFYGSYDWHSCVHGWWQLLRLARLFPAMPASHDIRELADRTFTATKLARELAYFERPESAGFERPYGWAWLLALHAEAQHQPVQSWAAALQSLAQEIAARFSAYLPKLSYPVRTGTHFNTSFACVLALAWARTNDPSLTDLIVTRAGDWFGEDRDCQAWEPSGDDFLSSALCEALLMSRTLTQQAFRPWFDAFLPQLTDARPATLLIPAVVSDRGDGKIAHLDGLNLSRAWCWRSIAGRLGNMHPAAPIAIAAAQRHLDASMPHLAGEYMGEHWLATFALLALLASNDSLEAFP
ncbi:MAG: DUF2891 domain-containing protein [Pseudomonadales bacterium]|nr:DUF2891 domain-containing protein [Pseudomonadales bacterium]